MSRVKLLENDQWMTSKGSTFYKQVDPNETITNESESIKKKNLPLTSVEVAWPNHLVRFSHDSHPSSKALGVDDQDNRMLKKLS